MIGKILMGIGLVFIPQISFATTAGQFQMMGFGCHGNPGWDMGSVIAAQADADTRAQRVCSPKTARRVSEYADELLDLDCQRSGKDGYSSVASYACVDP